MESRLRCAIRVATCITSIQDTTMTTTSFLQHMTWYGMNLILSLLRDSAAKMSVSSWTVILLLSTLVVTYGQQANTQDNCEAQETCTACIRTLNCTWCDRDDKPTEGSKKRCVNRQRIDLPNMKNWCRNGRIMNQKTNARVIENRPLVSEKGKPPVQIQPQVVNLKLRRGEEYRLKVRYSQAEDYPVDLYFLVDLSSSMSWFRDDLAALTDRIVRAMTSITSNFRLGFGSFVDKKLRPMITEMKDRVWINHYTFKNHLPMTNDSAKFRDIVGNSPVINTVDVPEGGFDGMVQAIVCQEEIGWRSDARHLLVHVSDASPHIAGDGKLAGAVEPNDEKCHLEKGTGLYHGEFQDYPSIGQINWLARKNDINIIFAANERFEDMYKKIQNVISNSAVGTFDKQSEAVLELIKGEYEKLLRSVRMTSNSTSDFLDIKFFSRCLQKDGDLQQRAQCDGLRVHLTVEFEVVIKAINCPERREDWNQIIEIKPEGVNEGVIVNVELICDCECSKNSDEKENAPPDARCNSHGVLDCGVCSCRKGYFGELCQCKGDQAWSNTEEDLKNCKLGKSLCSGRGKCECGSCACKEEHPGKLIYGKFCECDNFSCAYSTDGKLCGGHGRCDCGNCICDSGWNGPTCECKEDVSTCLPPGDNAKICSGAGKCECGRCLCDKEKGRNGRFCEDCPSCPSQRCDELKDCVECRVHKSGKLYAEDNTCSKCFEVKPVDYIEEDPDKLKPGEHVCRIAGNDGSTFVFTYVYVDGEANKELAIFAKKEKEFPVIDNFLAATLGVVLLTLLLGSLILVIWKISTHLHDKREYQKFITENSQAKWEQGQNPLYKEATMTFKNPAFQSGSSDDYF